MEKFFICVFILVAFEFRF